MTLLDWILAAWAVAASVVAGVLWRWYRAADADRQYFIGGKSIAVREAERMLDGWLREKANR